MELRRYVLSIYGATLVSCLYMLGTPAVYICWVHQLSIYGGTPAVYICWVHQLSVYGGTPAV